MNRRIVIGSFEVPGYGGAATVSYNLFESLRERGWDVWLLNLIAPPDAGYFRLHYGSALGNPRKLTGVENCFLSAPTFEPQPELDRRLEELDPDFLVGIGFIAAHLLKRAAPARKTLLYTTGCSQVKTLLQRGQIRDYLSLRKIAESEPVAFGRPCRREKDSVAGADLVLTHSEMNRELFGYFFPRLRPKIHPTVIWMTDWIVVEARSHVALARSFSERDVDVLFIASSWTRKEKNYPLVSRIIDAADGLNVHVVGEVETLRAGAKYHGLIPERERVFELMGNAKTVVCPSLFDAAPGILFEAAVMGANVVASRNCGNWQLCHEELRVDPPSAANFKASIRKSIEREYPANLEYFTSQDSTGQLMELLEAF